MAISYICMYIRERKHQLLSTSTEKYCFFFLQGKVIGFFPDGFLYQISLSFFCQKCFAIKINDTWNFTAGHMVIIISFTSHKDKEKIFIKFHLIFWCQNYDDDEARTFIAFNLFKLMGSFHHVPMHIHYTYKSAYIKILHHLNNVTSIFTSC